MNTHGSILDKRVAQEPVKAERLAVILVDFRELGLNGDLRRRKIQGLDGRFDDIQVLHGGPHHQDSAAIIKEQRVLGRRSEIDTRRLEKLANFVLNRLNRGGRGNTGNAAAGTTASTTTRRTATRRTTAPLATDLLPTAAAATLATTLATT